MVHEKRSPPLGEPFIQPFKIILLRGQGNGTLHTHAIQEQSQSRGQILPLILGFCREQQLLCLPDIPEQTDLFREITRVFQYPIRGPKFGRSCKG